MSGEMTNWRHVGQAKFILTSGQSLIGFALQKSVIHHALLRQWFALNSRGHISISWKYNVQLMINVKTDKSPFPNNMAWFIKIPVLLFLITEASGNNMVYWVKKIFPDSDIKIVRKGIFLLMLSLYGTSSQWNRVFDLAVRLRVDICWGDHTAKSLVKLRLESPCRLRSEIKN